MQHDSLSSTATVSRPGARRPSSNPLHGVRGLLASGLAVLLTAGCFVSSAVARDEPDPAEELVGLWHAVRRFGPELRGELTVDRQETTWRAQIAGHDVAAERADCTESAEETCALRFSFPGDRGTLNAYLRSAGSIAGHWIQPRTQHSGLEAASPVTLSKVELGRWQGEVVPLDDDFTIFLKVESREDGTVGAFLRNPERNIGVFVNIERIERDGDHVRALGRWRGSNEDAVLTEGSYDGENGLLSLRLRGWTYDFVRADDDPASAFHARGRDPEPFVYRVPPVLDDGWPVASLDAVGMTFEPLRRMIETEIDPADTSVHDLSLHGALIARHGKLVFEQYFHGFHRGRPHDTRSASKSAAALLVGAAIEAGEPVALDTPVYETILGDALPADLDPRARRITIEHLLTMSSGLDCDDRDGDSPGNEDRMQSQRDNLDWYDYTLSLGMLREPGAEAVYCSVNPNLVGNVLRAATGESVESLFHRLLAEPLDVARYHLYLQPTGEPYLGGGIHWLPRDFMKIGQVVLNGGVWNGKRVLGASFARRAVEPLVELRERRYGYLWWVIDYPYRGGTVRAFFAGGNGGQLVMGIPQLDLLVAFFAGNYSDRVMFRIQEELVPEYVLPAVKEEKR